MKQNTSAHKKSLGILICLTPILFMAAISHTDVLDVSSYISEPQNSKDLLQTQSINNASGPREAETLDTLRYLQFEDAELEGQIVDQDISLVEKDWIFRFTNRFIYSDHSVDCHISGSQKTAIANLKTKISETSSRLPADQFQLARILRNSRGQDCQRIAFELFLKSARLGYGRAFAEVANAYKKGLGVVPNFADALVYFEKSARLGFANSAYRLIELTEKGNDDFAGDPAKASRYLDVFLPLIESKVREGDAVAARSLGRLYNNSNLFQLDPDKAIRFMEYAANLGDAIAMHDLGLLLIQHRRAALTRDDVYPLFLRSSRLGYGAAFTAIGRLHLKGDFGFPKKDAANWFRSGVDAGHPGAMSELAALYFRGELVVHDAKIAKDLALQGARLNHRGSKRILDEILEWEENGQGRG